MIIGIDASRSCGRVKKTGVEKVSDELLSAIRYQLSDINTNIDVIFYAPLKIKWLPENKQKVFGPKKLWTVVGLSLEMIRNKPDVLFVPVHTLPFFCPKKTYKVIHDIAFRKHRSAYGFWQRLYLNFDLWRCKRICKKVIVPTEAVKNDLIELVGFSREKVEVARWGYKNKMQNSINPIQQAYGAGKTQGHETKKQILYIGRVEEKKNILNLIKAFEIFIRKYPEYKLVLAGKPGKGFEDFRSKIEDFRFVEYLGYVSDEEKYKLLRESACLVLVSKEEGFGIPVLEGFDFGLPVLSANIAPLREVGGDGCLYIDPENIEEIASGMEKITQDKVLRQQLIENGENRLKQFDWRASADKILQILGGKVN